MDVWTLVSQAVLADFFRCLTGLIPAHYLLKTGFGKNLDKFIREMRKLFETLVRSFGFVCGLWSVVLVCTQPAYNPA